MKPVRKKMRMERKMTRQSERNFKRKKKSASTPQDQTRRNHQGRIILPSNGEGHMKKSPRGRVSPPAKLATWLTRRVQQEEKKQRKMKKERRKLRKKKAQ